MTFWKTSFWAASATIARLMAQFLGAKFVAMFAGPAAFGIIGQFQSFVSIVQLGSGGIVSSGVAKYSAEFHSQPDKLEKLINTASKLVFIASLATGLLISVFSKLISELIFQDAQYYWLLIIFGLTLFGYAFNQIFLSVFNGLNEMRKYAMMSIIGAVISATLVALLSYFYHTNGALVGLVLTQFFLFFVSFTYIHKLPAQIKLITAKIDREALKRLLHFSLMAITSAVSLPVAQMVIRAYVVNYGSWSEAGYWQAVLKISDAYLLVVTTIIGAYALPKYSRIENIYLLKKEVLSVMLRVLPFTIILAFGVYFFRYGIILFLLSSDFLAAQSLFGFQLVGDVFRIASCVMANVLIAKAQVKTYVVLELLFTSIYCILSIYCYGYLGMKGLAIAFCINYVGYFLVVLIWFLVFVSNKRAR